jgi:polyhydroxyalkanoate synthesis regulator phasin
MSEPSEINAPQNAEAEELREAIQSLVSDVTALKAGIGEYYWRAFMANGQCEPELGGIFKEIQTKADEITSLEQEIQILEDGAGTPIQPPVRFQLERVECPSCEILL